MRGQEYQEQDWNDVFFCFVWGATQVAQHIKFENTDTVKSLGLSPLQASIDKRRNPKRSKKQGA